MSQQTQSSWLLLLHQVPPSPPYFRAKVLRRLNQVGALPIKNSAYILPELDETKEDFKWIHSEISQEGGEAWLFRTEVIAGFSNASLMESFRSLRNNDYSQLLDEAIALLNSMPADRSQLDRQPPEWRKLKRRFDEVRQIDFFQAPGRKELEEIMEKIEVKLSGTSRELYAAANARELIGKTWVTRRGVKVDRMASAWLIRRFVDAAARFLFVEGDRYSSRENQIRFDMFEGEFTHEGDLCTFEVLLSRLNLRDPALDAVAQIVHDIDLKDEKYQRPEKTGVAAAISGITALHADDERRIEEGHHLFEALYAAFRANEKG